MTNSFRLELQAGFARRIGQRLDAAVVRKTRAVEGDVLDAGSLRLFGDALADQGGSSDVATLARWSASCARTSASASRRWRAPWCRRRR